MERCERLLRCDSTLQEIREAVEAIKGRMPRAVRKSVEKAISGIDLGPRAVSSGSLRQKQDEILGSLRNLVDTVVKHATTGDPGTGIEVALEITRAVVTSVVDLYGASEKTTKEPN